MGKWAERQHPIGLSGNKTSSDSGADHPRIPEKNALGFRKTPICELCLCPSAASLPFRETSTSARASRNYGSQTPRSGSSRVYAPAPRTSCSPLTTSSPPIRSTDSPKTSHGSSSPLSTGDLPSGAPRRAEPPSELLATRAQTVNYHCQLAVKLSSSLSGNNYRERQQCPVRDLNPPHRIKSPALYQMS
jgi:hypothetical protein